MPELYDLIESYNRQQKNKFKQKVIDDCRLGNIIAVNVGESINGNDKFIKPWDLFPELFKEEQEFYEKQRSEQQFEDYKQQKREYASLMNAKRMGKEV